MQRWPGRTVSRLVGDGHHHKVLVADSDDAILVGIARSEGICECPQHHACLDEVVKLEALLCEAIEA